MTPVDFASGKQVSASTLWICLFIQIWGWQFAMQPQFSNESKKSHWFWVVSFFFSFKDMSYVFQIFYM